MSDTKERRSRAGAGKAPAPPPGPRVVVGALTAPERACVGKQMLALSGHVLTQEVEVEYLRYLGLKAAHPDQLLCPPKIVDHAWHAHLLCTRHYAAFCEKYYGQFLHHEPGVGAPANCTASVDLYTDAFGHHPPPSVWPPVPCPRGT